MSYFYLYRELLSKDAKHHQVLSADTTDQSKVPLVLDTMDDTFSNTYNAHPDRVYIIEGGILVYIGDNVMKQLQTPERLMTHEIRDWLEKRFCSDE